MADIYPSEYENEGYAVPQAGRFAGPVSYPTGGFVLNLTERFRKLSLFTMGLETIVATPSSATVERKRNVPGNGKVTIRLFAIVAGFNLIELPPGTNVSGVRWTFSALGT